MHVFFDNNGGIRSGPQALETSRLVNSWKASSGVKLIKSITRGWVAIEDCTELRSDNCKH